MKILLICQDRSIKEAFELYSQECGIGISSHSELQNSEIDAEIDRSSLVAFEMNPTLTAWLPVIREGKQRNPAASLVTVGRGSDEEISQTLQLEGDAHLTMPLRPQMLALTLKPLFKKSELQLASQRARLDATRIEEELRASKQRQMEATAEKDLTYRELLLAYSRLQSLNEQRNHFLATATHELRTPVTVMKGYHRILLDGRLGELPPQQREVLLESEQSCTRLIKIVNSLLDLSRIEAGKLELVLEDYDLSTNLKLIAGQMKDSAERKGLTVALKIGKNLPKVRCDREKINRVLANLLENAIKFTPQGGKIKVTGWLPSHEKGAPSSHKRRPGRRTQLSPNEPVLHDERSAIMIEVSDTGIGISPEHQQEIFEQFTQVPSNQMNRSGLGVGLAISKRIIEAHGGRIWFDSQVNSGSRFTFSLPLHRAHAPEARVESHSK